METQHTGRRFPTWKKLIIIPVCIVAGALLFGGAVMLLWNAILPQVLNVGTITFWQALGILLLAKILFGGFRGGWGEKRRAAMQWKQKWMSMTDEERAKFKDEWMKRRGC